MLLISVRALEDAGDGFKDLTPPVTLFVGLPNFLLTSSYNVISIVIIVGAVDGDADIASTIGVGEVVGNDSLNMVPKLFF